MALSRISVVIPPMGPWREQSAWYRWAEDVGYDVAYTYDHLTHRTAEDLWLGEAFTTLTAAAGCTHRIRLGTLVASAVFRRPVALARVAMTVQDISGGRLVLGIGLGAPDCERADAGAPIPLGQMADRFADVVHGYLATTGGATEWQGTTMSFSGLQSTPAPEGVVPAELLIAAHGPRALALAVEVADTWNTYGGPASTQLDDDEFWNLLGAQAAAFNAQCAKAGRDPATVRRSVLLGFGRVRPTSSVGAFLDAAARAEALGFDEMVVYAPPSSAGLGSDPTVHEQALARLR
ncbi:LLM class flavin-dependent oxidoreductase [Microbacterium sp. 2FI]|uniref:LLM class flavin-dependent oxidoreductase n=1 Tax=Microbacterium sp. 2FI TaxID=2502193 RepID=UPI0010F4817F|nr:LLM class flavin-dependent oxidoreductase [Microbacterium sp. 2FI]